MSVSRLKQHRVVLGSLLLAAAVAACDSAPTRPLGPLSPFDTRHIAFEGDTTQCLKGWVIVDGVVRCNQE